MVTKKKLQKPNAKTLQKNIKALDDFIKAYEKQKEAQAVLNDKKEKLIEHLKDNDLNSTTYKKNRGAVG